MLNWQGIVSQPSFFFMRLVLASTSPRRREILALLGVPFDAITPEFEERLSPDLSTEEQVLAFALGKARSVAHRTAHTVVIGSDTMIELDGEKIGKPTGHADAGRILRLLSGRTHWIYTSLAILEDYGKPGLARVEKVAVDMLSYTDKEVEQYLAHGESLDKAGAYSIQGEGSRLIKSIRGDYLAAVGMPLKPISDYLKTRGMTPTVDVDQLYAGKTYLNWRMFA
jgi:septum formation protein